MSQILSGTSPEAVEKRLKESRAALKRMQDNPRVSQIVIIVPQDACQACREIAGTYQKGQTPEIPMDACSHPLGCRAFYQPFLDDLYP